MEHREAFGLLVDRPLAARESGANGTGATRSSTYRQVPATCPSTRKVGIDCGIFVANTFSRCSSGRIRARLACPSRSSASNVERKRTGRRGVAVRARRVGEIDERAPSGSRASRRSSRLSTALASR